MWVVYLKSNREIVGASGAGGKDRPKEDAMEEIVRGLAAPQDISAYDAIQIEEPEKIQQFFGARMRRTARLVETAGKVNFVEQAAEEFLLAVTVEGTQDLHPVDQVPLMPANPTSFVTIRLQKTDATGKPMTRKTLDKDVLWLRTDAGFLRADQGPGGTTSAGMMPPDIRSVTLVSGAASFRLYADTVKRLATVQILSTDPRLNATVRVELI